MDDEKEQVEFIKDNIVNHRCFIMPTPSTIVNIQHIRKIDGKNKKLILENDDEILISRRKYNRHVLKP